MPLIQIEQDSPDVIERARQELASTVRRIASGRDRHVESMMFMGYLRALTFERLISHQVLDQLNGEVDRALDALTAQAPPA